MDYLEYTNTAIVLLGPPAKKTFEARITVNETYKPEYNDSSSAEFKEFASNFSKTVGEFFIKKQLPGFQRVEVKKLSKGSVVVDFDIEVQKSSNATVESIVKALVGGNGTAELGYTFFGTPTVNAAQQSPTSSAPAGILITSKFSLLPVIHFILFTWGEFAF